MRQTGLRLFLNLQSSVQDVEKVIASHHSGMKEASLEGICM